MKKTIILIGFILFSLSGVYAQDTVKVSLDKISRILDSKGINRVFRNSFYVNIAGTSAMGDFKNNSPFGLGFNIG